MKKVRGKISKSSGRSKSQQESYGIRRKVQGRELAPRCLRKDNIFFLDECEEKDLKKAKIE